MPKATLTAVHRKCIENHYNQTEISSEEFRSHGTLFEHCQDNYFYAKNNIGKYTVLVKMLRLHIF